MKKCPPPKKQMSIETNRQNSQQSLNAVDVCFNSPVWCALCLSVTHISCQLLSVLMMFEKHDIFLIVGFLRVEILLLVKMMVHLLQSSSPF